MWHLSPKIDGAYWSGADVITVGPLQSKNYELTYRPLVMTNEGRRHQVREFQKRFNKTMYLFVGMSSSLFQGFSIVRDSTFGSYCNICTLAY